MWQCKIPPQHPQTKTLPKSHVRQGVLNEEAIHCDLKGKAWDSSKKHPQHPQVAANFRSSLHDGVETRHMVSGAGYVKATAAEILLGGLSKLVYTTHDSTGRDYWMHNSYGKLKARVKWKHDEKRCALRCFAKSTPCLSRQTSASPAHFSAFRFERSWLQVHCPYLPASCLQKKNRDCIPNIDLIASDQLAITTSCPESLHASSLPTTCSWRCKYTTKASVQCNMHWFVQLSTRQRNLYETAAKSEQFLL